MLLKKASTEDVVLVDCCLVDIYFNPTFVKTVVIWYKCIRYCALKSQMLNLFHFYLLNVFHFYLYLPVTIIVNVRYVVILVDCLKRFKPTTIAMFIMYYTDTFYDLRWLLKSFCLCRFVCPVVVFCQYREQLSITLLYL